MEPTKEQFHLRRIAELENQVSELTAQVATLTEQVARLSKNSSNSSPYGPVSAKPPSSDIVKPPKGDNKPKGPRKQGGQSGHPGVHRPPFRPDQIDRRITQGSRSPMGRQWNARIWTVLDTCRKQGRSAWQFLQNALFAYHFQTPTPSLLPQAS